MTPFVLVVEDDEDMRRTLRDVLMTWDYHVAVAADAFEAREWLSRHPGPSAIVLDMLLPGAGGHEVGGRELLRWIRERPEPTRSVPVIIFSAAYPTVLEEIARRHGADAVLEKPAGIRRLIPVLERLVPA